jgi:hypothetical protein
MPIDYFDVTIAVLFEDHQWDERNISHLAVDYGNGQAVPEEVDVLREAKFHLVGRGEGEVAVMLLNWDYSQESEKTEDD